ncbi:hypothetical protein [Allosalinactinospora lopnorensis]|uniref:hypothetical protein n=1 Tax=Allosalinactinospora lopnorensis TaxID=1352348 RepID=UPI001F47EC67|nr:hypothetical protein [Allosalinactinospora lopnorensis]
MPHDVSTSTRPRLRATPWTEYPWADVPAQDPAPTAAPPFPEGIGDIALAGQPTGYAHLAARGTPTVGQFTATAREASAVLARPAFWPRRRGHWQPAPRPARRRATGRMRIAAVALEPNEFVALPALGGAASGSGVLYLAHGRAHMVTSAPDGEMLAVQELDTDRARVLAAGDRHRLVNTGTETAVVVRVAG